MLPILQSTAFSTTVLEDTTTEQHILPKMIPVELFPLDASTLAAVQSVYQNPHIRIEIPGDTNLSDLLEFLERKWHGEQGFCLKNGINKYGTLETNWDNNDLVQVSYGQSRLKKIHML